MYLHPVCLSRYRYKRGILLLQILQGAYGWMRRSKARQGTAAAIE